MRSQASKHYKQIKHSMYNKHIKAQHTDQSKALLCESQKRKTLLRFLYKIALHVIINKFRSDYSQREAISGTDATSWTGFEPMT